MRFVAGVAVGVAVGLLAAYAFRAGDTPPRDETHQDAPAPSREPEAAKAPEPPQNPPPRRRGPLLIRHTGGVTTSGDTVFVPEGEVVGAGPRTMPEIRRALEEARAAADWEAFFQALHELGALGTDESEALLVELMGDETLRFAGAWTGQSFLQWLAGSDAPGLLEAARKRAEIDVADNPDSRWRGAGWLGLVAIFGGEAEIAWIESLGGDRNREMEVDRALAEAARNPLAAARLAARLKQPSHFLWSPYLSTFAQENPPAALDAAIEALPAAPDRRTGDLLRLIGDATTPETLERARAALLRQEDPATRFEALRAVERMRRRGLDVSGFARLADEPRLLLERSASRPLSEAERGLVRRALDAVTFSRVTWNDATLAAVRAYLGHADKEIAEAAREAIADVEEAAKGDGWRPDRSGG